MEDNQVNQTQQNQDANPEGVAKERSLQINDEAQREVLTISNGHKLVFVAELDTETYMKMKQNTQKVLLDTRSRSGYVPLQKEYEYFSDLCESITDKDGNQVPVSQDYLKTIKVPDLVRIENVIRDLITFDLGK